MGVYNVSYSSPPNLFTYMKEINKYQGNLTIKDFKQWWDKNGKPDKVSFSYQDWGKMESQIPPTELDGKAWNGIIIYRY